MALAAAIAEANREKAVTLPALGAERTSSSKPEKRLGDLGAFGARPGLAPPRPSPLVVVVGARRPAALARRAARLLLHRE